MAGVLAMAALLAWAARTEARVAVTLAAIAPPVAGDRVLVVAPHPDDETLCCAGYVQRALQAGAAVAVVWITAGDSFEIDAVIAERTLRPKGSGLEKLGARRIAEAQAAATLLGVPHANQFVLGYPDRGLTALLADGGDIVHRSAYTNVDSVPYAQALSPGRRYTGNSLRSDLETVITRFSPTVVLLAAPQDRHADHRASGALALELLARKAPQTRAYYWIVHASHRWPWPLGLHRQRPLLPPASAKALDWQQLPLDDAQQLRKLGALRAHRSQREVMGLFLNAFVRSNELFAPAQ